MKKCATHLLNGSEMTHKNTLMSAWPGSTNMMIETKTAATMCGNKVSKMSKCLHPGTITMKSMTLGKPTTVVRMTKVQLALRMTMTMIMTTVACGQRLLKLNQSQSMITKIFYY